MQELVKDEPSFWTNSIDCCGRMAIRPETKFLAALKTICYGVSFSAFQSYFQMGETTARECVSKLSRGIVNNQQIRDTYLRLMNKSDARRVSKLHSEKHGINGMLGSLDCMHVRWDNCPYVQRGQHVGKDKKPTLVLEGLADNNLWFWHHAFGLPGGLNDINVWERSDLCKAFVDGSMHDLDFKYILNDEERSVLYYLVDGIYPELARFVKTIAVPITKKESLFATWQEAARKDIERAFGVLQKKFHYLVHPVRQFFVHDIFYVVKACIALHNMMVEVRIGNDENEDPSFYDVITDDSDDDSNDPDPAVEAVQREDEYFASNADRLDIHGDNLDVELLKDYRKSQLLGERTRIVQERWKSLCDGNAHVSLQNAVINHLFGHVGDE
jgi:hypothetical protein